MLSSIVVLFKMYNTENEHSAITPSCGTFVGGNIVIRGPI